MGQYKIHVLRHDGSVALVVTQTCDSDLVAFRLARHAARERRFEVWRGAERIYRSNSLPPDTGGMDAD